MKPPWSDGEQLLGRLRIKEERAGGGPGPTGGGPEQEDRGRNPTDPGRRRLSDSILNAGGAFTNRMTAETLGVRTDIAYVIYICTWAVTTTRSGTDSF